MVAFLRSNQQASVDQVICRPSSKLGLETLRNLESVAPPLNSRISSTATHSLTRSTSEPRPERPFKRTPRIRTPGRWDPSREHWLSLGRLHLKGHRLNSCDKCRGRGTTSAHASHPYKMHLEEITDKIDSSLKVSEDKPTPKPAAAPPSPPPPLPTPPQKHDAQAPAAPQGPIGPAPPPAPVPALPPQLAHNAGKSVDEILADLNKSPLFMTELEEDNEHLEALQALAYEGTPLENATDFKESGNEAFRERRWADAREHYGRGVAVVVGEEKRRAEGRPPRENDEKGDDPAEAAAQRAVLEALHVNRAACHLELRNHRSCWLDCNAALRLNSRNLKAWYRAARALLAVGRTDEADEACAAGLAVDPDNGPLRTIAREVAAKKEAARKKVAEEERRRLEDAQRRAALRAALEARGVRVRSSGRPPDMGDAKLELVEAGEGGGEATLTFPTVLLYPAHYESDFIKAFSERETLMQHFGYVFPLPWDLEGEYSPNGVECFMETTSGCGGLVRVGKKVALLKVLSMDNVEVVDGVVKIYVVPKAKAEGWVKEFKAAKAKEKEREAAS